MPAREEALCGRLARSWVCAKLMFSVMIGRWAADWKFCVFPRYAIGWESCERGLALRRLAPYDYLVLVMPVVARCAGSASLR